jgi:hypothetical protein
LQRLDKQIQENKTNLQTKEELIRVVSQYEQVLGLDKRVCTDAFDKSIAEVDAQPLNFLSYEIQSFLFEFCGFDPREESTLKKRPLRKDLLGNIKKVPLKSTLLSSFLETDKKLLA